MMKTKRNPKLSRLLIALLVAAFIMSFCFAGALPDVVLVGNADEFTAALSDAASSPNATILRFSAGASAVDLGGYVAIPSTVSVDLSAGVTLRVSGVLSVAGAVSGGAIEVIGGTLVRESGSSITATITVSSGGVVRGARVLTLENLSATSTETITSISYSGSSGSDTSSYVTRAVNAVLYVKMSGTNYSAYQPIETVITSAGNLFRLGTKNTDTLSLTYALTYGGLAGAKLTSLNPVSYTASDSAILLNNPTKDGSLFVGWTCEQLGVTAPNDKLVIPEGTTGELTFIATWAEAAGGGKIGGTSGSDSDSSTTSEDDAQAQQDDAAAQQEQQSTRRTRTASSSTKVSFTSDVVADVPTITSVRGGESSPWGLVFAGLAGLGLAAYITARLVNRKHG
jgi:uncharacterized repeat protein (TIGR02543 family)